MADNIVTIPYSYFPDFSVGRPLFNADIYVGLPDLDPQNIPSNQKAIRLRTGDGTEVSVPQPVNTGSGGVISYNGSPAQIITDGAYSILVNNSNGTRVYYSKNVTNGTPVTIEGIGGITSLQSDSVANMLTGTLIGGSSVSLALNQVWMVNDYYGGLSPSGSGALLFKIVPAGTGTADGGKYIDIPGGLYQAQQNLKLPVSVKAYGAKGDGTTDDFTSFTNTLNYSNAILIPSGTYLLGSEVSIRQGQTWIADNATLKHNNDQLNIVRANGITDFAILGSLTIEGLLTAAETQPETGLYITSCSRYKISGVTTKKFKGAGIKLDGVSTPTGLRGDRGQFSDCAAFESTVGIQIDAGAGAEYNTWSNTNISGCVDGLVMAAGNNIFTGGSIVDNSNVGVKLLSGTNHCHGMFVGVNINHNAVYNVQATQVTFGHDFIGCHFYGNSLNSSSGAIFLDRCKGITFRGGNLDCWVYNFQDANSGNNFISDMWCPGSYGDVRLLNESSSTPTQLIVSGCYGEGSYTVSTPINDPSITYVHARRLTGGQSLSSPATLIFGSLASNGDRRNTYDTTTGRFLCPNDSQGTYEVKFNAIINGTGLSDTASYIDVRVNGTARYLCLPKAMGSTKLAFNDSVTIELNAGDTVELLADITGTSPDFGDSTYSSDFIIRRID